MRSLFRLLIVLVVLLAVAVGFVKVQYGQGQPYEAPYAPTQGRPLTPVVTLDFPLGNVATSSSGRIFFNIHPFAHAHRFTDAFLFELVEGQPRPYPDQGSQADLSTVFGMTVDLQGRLWLTCPATLDREQTRLLAYDLKTGQRVLEHSFAPGVARFAQDMRVTADGRTMIMADTGLFRFTSAALLVVDLETFEVRRVLQDHSSTAPQPWYITTFEGSPLRLGYGLVTFAVGVDGIEISGDHVVYATMTHDSVFRVPLKSLQDPSLSPEALAAQVERVGPKPLSDGITIAPDGGILITDIEHGALARLDPNGTLTPFGYAKEIIWSDGVAATASVAYVTDSAIPAYVDPLARPPAKADIEAHAPYGLYRIALSP